MNVNTISLNIGKRGDVQGQFVSESPPLASKRESKGKSHFKTHGNKKKEITKNKKKEKEEDEDIDAESSEESEDSNFLRQPHFRRACCHEMKISDH